MNLYICHKLTRVLTAAFVSSILSLVSLDAVPAFPGAEGFGAAATGGRGGEVYIVTNLNDSGAGSFRDAVTTGSTPRTVVFAVGGVININSAITVRANITIAGQTAPGDGITVYGNTVAFKNNVICRYLRIHGSINMNSSSYALSAGGASNVIFDHVSVTWGRWDNIKLDGSSTGITFQYCLVGEAILPQYLGALFEGAKKITVHHTLWANNHSRNPKAKADIEYINNVVYNWGGSGFVGGHSGSHFYQDLINNYFIGGPSSSNSFISGFGSTDHVYHSGNYADTDKDGSLNGRLATDTDFTRAGAALAASRSNLSPVAVTTDDAATAVQKVMAKAGASDRRDPVDARMIAQLSSCGALGALVAREGDAGGQPAMTGGIPPADTNATGIPDWWAGAMGRSTPADTAYANAVRDDGYTNLEFYLNSIVTSGMPDVVITGITPSGNSDISAADPLTGGSITNTSTGFAINGAAPAGATVEVSAVDTGPNAATATADGTGNWTLTISGVTERQYAFTARVKRAADDYSLPSAAHAVRVKRTADAAPVIDRFVVSASEKTFSGAAAPYSQIAVKVASGPDQTGTVVATAIADGYGNWDAALTSAVFQSADYAFTAAATDLAGNTSADSARLTVAMGIASPVFTGITSDTGTSAADQITTDQTLIFNGTADASATITVYRLNGTVATVIGSPVMADASGDWTFDYTATTLPAGTHTFFATTGNGGGSSPMSAPFVVTIDRTAPTVASINRLTPGTTNTSAGTLVFRVTFAESVTGVAQNNFTVTRTGSGMAGNITGFTQVDARVCEVTVTGAAGDGTIRVNLDSNLGNIKDLAGNTATASYTSGQTYTMRYVGSGVWNTDADAAWSDATAWEDDVIADGIGATADFGTVDISEETVVALDSARTLGRLIFADADEESAGTWRIAADESSPAASITLANPGGATPEIRVTYENMGDGGTQNYHKAANGRNHPVIIDTPFNSSSGLLKSGWGTLQLNNIGVFSGSIGVQQGYLKIGPGAKLDMTQPLNLPEAGSGLIVAGGTFSTTAGVNMVFTSENMILVSGGRADFKTITSGNNRNGRIEVTGGVMTADQIMLQRSADGPSGYGNGVIVKGGTATIGTLGVGTTNSWGATSIEGGRLIITGALWIGWQTSGTRGGQVRVTGGELVSTDTVNGIVMSRKNGSNAYNIAELHIIGGTVTAARIALGYDSTVNTGSAIINLNAASAALYLGTQGLVKNGAGSFNATVNLTRGTLGADADWSTTVPLVVTSGSGNITIKAASAANVPHNITLSGTLSGSGTITKTGAGVLTLAAANTATGPITVSEGTLTITGSLASSASGAVTIASGATLAGTGAINRPVTLQSGAGLALNPSARLTISSGRALTKTGAGQVALSIVGGLPTTPGTYTLATFGSTGLTAADFAPITGPSVRGTVQVTATALQLLVVEVDYNAELLAALDAAGIFIADASIGAGHGQYPQTALNALNGIITAIRDAIGQPGFDAAGALADLQTALATFTEAQITVNFSALDTALDDAADLLDDAADNIGEGHGQYPQTAIAAFADAIDDAQSTRDKLHVTQAEIADALAALEDAMETFEDAAVVVDFSALNDEIAAAAALLAEAAPGAGHGQHPQNAIDAFTLARAAALAVSGQAGVTPVQVAAALGTLQNATSTFTAAQITVDFSAIDDALDAAETLLGGATAGSGHGQYPQTAIAAFTDAIDTVQSVRDKSHVTQAEIDDAFTTLENAMETFGDAVVIVDFTALLDALDAAETLLDDATAGEGHGQHAQADIDAFAAAIAGTKAVATTPAVTQAAVNTACSALQDVVTAFTGAVVVVDFSALDNEIATVAALLAEAVPGAGHGQHAQADIDTFDAAIAAARAVSGQAGATPVQVAAALGTLQNATATFTAAQITVDFSAIDDALAAAKNLLRGATVGAGHGQHAQADIDTLAAAITEAGTVATTPAVTQAAVNDALVMLQNAVATFRATARNMDFSTLESGLDDADVLLAGAISGAAASEYPPEAMDALAAVISTVKAVAGKPGVTQTEIDTSQRLLAHAVAAFEAAQITDDDVAAPSITRHPIAQTVRPGATASFTAAATGNGLRYQWQKDGANIAGATTDALFIINAKSADAGVYRVIVTNDHGEVTSNDARLTLEEPPGDGGGGAPAWPLPVLLAALLALRAVITRRRK
jgi:autotransporter-associated beta strand protein